MKLGSDADEVNDHVVRSSSNSLSCLEVLSTKKKGVLSRSSSSLSHVSTKPQQRAVEERRDSKSSNATASFQFASAQRRPQPDIIDNMAGYDDPDRITVDGLRGIQNNDPDMISYDDLRPQPRTPGWSERRNQMKLSIEQHLMKVPAQEQQPPRRKVVSDIGWRRKSKEEHGQAAVEEHISPQEASADLHALCQVRSIETVDMKEVEGEQALLCLRGHGFIV